MQTYEFHYYISNFGWEEIYTNLFSHALLIKILYGCNRHKTLSANSQVIFMQRVHRNLMPLHLKRYMFDRLYS